MTEGPWQKAWNQARSDPRFVDLTDSRFHQNGLLPDRQPFAEAFARWLDQRAYEPDSRGDLRARTTLKDFYASVGWNVPADNFFLTAGTSEAYSLLFSTFGKAGDRVALPRPGYPLFDQLVGHSRLKAVFYDQPFDRAWQPSAESLEASLTPDTRFVVVISPNNPTGQTLSVEALEPIARLCRDRDLMLVVDEVFDACWPGPEPLPRPGALFPEVKTFTLNGISKRFGSPDLKLAWIAISGPARWAKTVGQRLELANDAFLSANSFSQFLLPDLFRTMDPWQERLRDLLEGNRRAAEAWMAGEPRVRGILPRGGIHGLWRFEGLPRDWDDEAWAVELLDRDQLALHPGFFYEVPESGVWLVYSLLKEPKAFSEGLDRLAFRMKNLF